MTIAKNCRIFVDGADLACALTEISFSRETEAIDATTLCTDGSRSFLPGLKSGTLPMTGIWDADEIRQDKIDDVLRSAFSAGRDLICTASLGAITIGGLALMAKGMNAKYEVMSPTGQLVMASAEMNTDSGINSGVWLFNDATTSGGGLREQIFDSGAPSTNGGLFHAHTYLKPDSLGVYSAFTLQHSTNNTTWVDLITAIGIATANGAVAVSVPRGTTVHRYLKVIFSVGGGITYGVAAFKRF